MRRRLWIAMFVPASLVLAALGCGLDVNGTDFGDFGPFDDAATDTATDSSGGDADSASDGSPGDATPLDAGPCPQPVLPLCDNDPSACSTGSACAPPIPSGWTLSSMGPAAAACPSGFAPASGGAPFVQYDTSGTASCQCGCTTTPGGCAATGSFSLGGGGVCAVDQGNVGTSPACTAVAITGLGLTFSARVSHATTGSTCQPTTTAAIPPVDAGLRHVCGFDEDAGALCADHRFCVPLAADTDRACIAHEGSVACPSGFPFTLAQDIDDTRACVCGCTAQEGKCTGNVRLYPSTGCAGGGDFAFPYDGGCVDVDAAGAGGAYQSATLESTVASGASCSANGGLQGSVDASVTTVCCATP